ncbi:aspartate aminotransferase family protein [Alicyclobacillaceae bacterium I2511]|nr:aspartate aminotransferase family protein [Alicyclobacillaceae bacterium I2511]
MEVVHRTKLKEMTTREMTKFSKEHPQSNLLYKRAKNSLFAGVPMNWMTKWAGGFPVFVKQAKGSHFVDVDGLEYVDFCLGDTGAMTGHSPSYSVDAIVEQSHNGLTFMLPTENALWVSEELSRRFGLPYWQFTLTATDANRFALRIARAVTGRNRILVFNWCYHGTVDETFITLRDHRTGLRTGNLGPAVNPSETTRVIEFNDIDALEEALSHEDVACVIAEPVMTNIGIIHPDPGYHDALRTLTRRYGTLLILDETHTICSGPGGYTGKFQLEPDIFTIGKAIASGIPAGAYGLSAKVAEQLARVLSQEETDTSGIGGTLAGNALSIAAMRATLEFVWTEDNFYKMISLATQFAAGVNHIVTERSLAWHVTQLGARVEYLFQPNRPKNGTEAAASWDHELDHFIHLYMLNRGILLTPFHNMALMSPSTSQEDVDFHTKIFQEVVDELTF